MAFYPEPCISRTALYSKYSRIFCPTWLCLWIIFGAIALGLAGGASAQDTSQPPSSAPQAQPPASPSAGSQAVRTPVAVYTFLQRKSIFFPDIAVGSERLSTGQKFQLFVDNSISLHTVTWAMLGSAVGQADDSPTGFGQGWDGYAKRFGSSMGRQASSQFFGTFILASAMHQDPRFYAEINPPFFHAMKYSVQRVFITRDDNGNDVPNYSGLLGPLMSEGLANVYWPDRNRTVGDTLFRYGLDLASKAGGNMLREYWPVIYRKITHEPQPNAGNH
ncbi:MAG: hypothetical protein ACLPN2_00990 [Terriglobales bacterium]